MKLPDEMTIGESYGPAMKITTQQEADEYFEALVERNMRITGNSREKAIAVEKSNLGYCAGYYDLETSRRVQELFDCVHPILGSAKGAFEKGRELTEGSSKSQRRNEKC